MLRKSLITAAAVCLVCLTASGCVLSDSGPGKMPPRETKPEVSTKLPKTDMGKWEYDSEQDIYYQLGISYCESPADENYEQLAVFVPGMYMDAYLNGDGTYTCKLKNKEENQNYDFDSAPIIMPIRTEGYAAAEPITKDVLKTRKSIFEEISDYTSQGFIYAVAGCRGINEGAPLGAADLKAAVRYIRYNDDVLPGDAEKIYIYGMSAGGAIASVLGASGNSPIYTPYLEAIGAIQGVSDAVAGVMAWCPVTDLDTANAGYEWMMGCTRQGRTTDWNMISAKLAAAYADYVNSAGFTGEDGQPLLLEKSESGIYQAGSYYDYLKTVIERSLNNYFADQQLTDAETEAYIKGLNSEKKWITYDKATKTASITSIEDFVKTCKKASELPVAFDWPGSGNTLFGKSNGRGAHFDKILSNILTELKSEYADEYAADMELKDSLGTSVEQRVKMYAPLYFLLKNSDGFGSSEVAKHWRIRSGIEQPTTSLTTEVNLALALRRRAGVESVDFETVWAQGHEPVERSGDSTENFILWVKDCVK